MPARAAQVLESALRLWHEVDAELAALDCCVAGRLVGCALRHRTAAPSRLAADDRRLRRIQAVTLV